MKFATFKRHSKLIQNSLSKLLEHATTLSEVKEVEDKHRLRALSVNSSVAEKQKEYNGIRDNVLNTPDSITETDEPELEAIDSTISDLFFDLHETLRPLLPSSNEDSFSDHNASAVSHNKNSSSVRLPKIQLKTFNGDISQWIAFQNVFEVTVHKNKSLVNIEKFQYLLSCLSDEPFNLIKALPLSNDNYVTAYDTLVKRYHNPRILKSLHINHLIDMPSCNDSSAKQLRHFISQFNEHSSALSSLDVSIHEDNPVLITLLLRKFDTNLRTRFETKRENSQELPTPKEFIEFLENECLYMENAHLIHSQNVRQNVSQPVSVKSRFAGFSRNKNVSLTTQNAASNASCPFCNQNHVIYSCNGFSKLDPSERFTFVKSNNMCVNCLGTHKYSECSSKSTCRTCSKKHHTFLHQNTPKATNQGQSNGKQTVLSCKDKTPGITSQVNKTSSGQPPHPTQESPDNNYESPSVQQSVCTVNGSNELFTTLLGTALVKLSSSEGNSLVVRALVDSASTCTFINTDVVNKLQLKLQHTKHTNQVNGISATPVNTKGVTHVNVKTLSNKQISNNHPVLVLSKITTDMPSAQINNNVVESLSNFKLADPNFHKCGPIQMLIGADLFMQIIKPSKYSLGENMPYALDTDFGFIVIGKTPVASDLDDKVFVNHTILHCLQDDNLDKLISNFWTLEQPPEPSKLSEDDIKCEQHFSETHSRNPETGKYTVKLPFKDNPEKLGDSTLSAKRRFFSLERKLNTQPEFKQLYSEFMSDYESTGHMSVLVSPLSNKPHYFLPHHGVIKESSSSTRLRVVFDASSKTSTDLSLNDILHVGPKLHNDISTIITNFRRYKYVFTTDVKQMFRSIDMDKDDRPYQLIYWRDSPQKPLSIYQLNTVTYGLCSSPYQANRVVVQLAQDEENNFPVASRVLRKHIYVDDVALGADTIESALSLQNDVKSLLEKGGFHLRKWTANHNELLKDIPKEFHGQPVVFRTPDQPLISILGLQWIPSSDCFTYKINFSHSEVCTKRVVLSDIAKIFDPCGFLSPVVIKAKIFIQTLWTRGLDWDSPLPTDLVNEWKLFTEQLPSLENVMLPRHFKTDTSSNIQLHGFCDASEVAFGACVYLRVTDSHNNTHVTLIVAKTRVAPLKRVSLPRLELCGAHLLAQLMHFCSNNLLSNQMNIDSIHAWTDSTVTLNWIRTQPYKLKTYVANRVTQIQELLPITAWSHVPSQQNPADCASRGIFPQDIITHNLWWSGPQWLIYDADKWPKMPDKELNRNQIPELKSSIDNTLVASSSTHELEHILLTKYSSWSKLQRIVAFMLRFAHNTRPARSKLTGNLSSDELLQSTTIICRAVQQQEFATEYESLTGNKAIKTHVNTLSPFLDENGVIRVGGRLKNAHISSHAKHPILLPKSHHISALIVDYYHLKYLHAGPQLLQSLIAQHFWILSARNLIRSRIHKCLTCFRHRPKTVYPLMGNLPGARVNPSSCFKVTGLDYAGPFDMKVHSLRRANIVKCYVCLFVCFATKAIHIELVSDLSSDTFIAALTRFVSRRGSPTDIHLDNATAFVGASNQFNKIIKELLQIEETKENLHKFSTEHSTKFHFIPPSAPHQGGIWESGVKSMKTHLKRVVGDRILTQEEFLTLCTRIEAILNSRPLCPLSSDPSENDVLTPGHFLIGRPMVALPELDYVEVPTNRLKRWQAVQAITQQLWKRWKRDYLHTLQQRGKWTTKIPNLEINDLVLLHSNSPPQSWPLGRIIATHPGTDGVTRVVTLQTSNGVFTRPVVKVSPLPK